MTPCTEARLYSDGLRLALGHYTLHTPLFAASGLLHPLRRFEWVGIDRLEWVLESLLV